MLVDVVVWVVPPALCDVPDPGFVPHQCDARNVDECVESPPPACFTELVKGGHSLSVPPDPPLHRPQLEPSFFGNGHTVCHPISLRIQYHRIISVAHEYDIRKDSFLFHMIEEWDFSEPA